MFWYVESAHDNELKAVAASAAFRKCTWLLVFAAAADENEAKILTDRLRALGRPYAGGVFPGLIHDMAVHTRGMLLFPMTGERPVLLQAPEAPPSGLGSMEQGGSGLLLADGRSSAISEYLELVQGLLPGIPLTGGGAGYPNLQPRPCLFDTDGYYADALLVVRLKSTAGFAVQHGWERMSDPLVVTSSNQTNVHTLNWKPAFPLYQEIVLKNENARVEAEFFYEVAKSYPFGLYREHGEFIIRDPLGVGANGTDLICVGDVPRHATVYVMKGTPDSLIASARKAMDSLHGLIPSHRFMFDCISRYLFLGDRFKEELDTAHVGLPYSVVPGGALTLGEIAPEPSGALMFLNKTLVVTDLYGGL